MSAVSRSRHRGRQAGAALLTAMIIVALIATLAASMLWQQWRAVQVEAAERERAQSAWILSGALDWARLILREDAKSGGNGGIDHLGEPWAVPLQEARLSSFLATDAGPIEDAPEAFLSGEISDAQARFNLGNLVVGNKIDETALAGFAGLCESLGVAGDVATRIAAGIRDATPVIAPDPSAGTTAAVVAPANPPLMPRSVRDLAWFGVDAESQRVLEPYVVLLPQGTQTNINTASREVLAASIKGLDLATAERLVQYRQRTPFKTRDDMKAQATGVPPESFDRVGWGSKYFIIRGRLRLGQVVLEQRSLVYRDGTNLYVMQRERIPGRDTTGS